MVSTPKTVLNASQRQSLVISLTAFFTALLIIALVSVLLLISFRGMAYFWPEPVYLVTTETDGQPRAFYANVYSDPATNEITLKYSDSQNPYCSQMRLTASDIQSKTLAKETAEIKFVDGRRILARPVHIVEPSDSKKSLDSYEQIAAEVALISANIEKIFAMLMVVTACCMAFAHGSNDVANAIGPLAAVVSVVTSGGEINANSELAPWILPLGGLGIVAGLALFGHRVIKTIGQGITHLTPSRGFAAELAAACTVVIASGTGLPISTTQTLVGAVLGVGMARGVSALNLGIVRNIVVSWVITLPAGAILAIICFFGLKAWFGVE